MEGLNLESEGHESALRRLTEVAGESFVDYRKGIKGQIYWDCLTA